MGETEAGWEGEIAREGMREETEIKWTDWERRGTDSRRDWEGGGGQRASERVGEEGGNRGY